MKEAVRELIDAVDAVTDEAAVKTAISTFTRKVGYQRFAYLQAAATDLKAFSNYPRKWQRTYLNGTFSRVDPVIFEAKRLKVPFTWSADSWKSARGSKETRVFRDQAMEFGIRSGVSIPISGSYGRMLMLTLASGKPHVDSHLTEEDPVELASAILAIHYRLRMIGKRVLTTPRKQLSPREAACLRWSSNGLKAPEIATVLHLETGTVQRYLDSARAKLDAATLTHAVRLAMDHKIL